MIKFPKNYFSEPSLCNGHAMNGDANGTSNDIDDVTKSTAENNDSAKMTDSSLNVTNKQVLIVR